MIGGGRGGVLDNNKIVFPEKVVRRWTSQRIRKHIPAGWCFLSVLSHGEPPPRRRVKGPDASVGGAGGLPPDTSVIDTLSRHCLPSIEGPGQTASSWEVSDLHAEEGRTDASWDAVSAAALPYDPFHNVSRAA